MSDKVTEDVTEFTEVTEFCQEVQTRIKEVQF